jgi:predicted CoA-substrate-specific enzyme activase
LGIDIGSYYTKGCLIDGDSRILAAAVLETGISFEKTAKKIILKMRASAGQKKEDIQDIVSTGMGRACLSSRTSARTEISCVAKGVSFYYPEAMTIIDIGGQDIKIVKINGDQRNFSFKLSRKCAAGTGSFLEEISRRLKIPINEMNRMAETAKKSVEIGSFCTVFAGTEVLHLLREGKDIHEILRGVYESVVERVLSIVSVSDKYALTGGVVAHHPIVTEIFREKTRADPLLLRNPQTIVAFGAALFALEAKR